MDTGIVEFSPRELFLYSYDVSTGNVSLGTFRVARTSRSSASSWSTMAISGYWPLLLGTKLHSPAQERVLILVDLANLDGLNAFSMVSLSLFMQVIREMEESIDHCREKCSNLVCQGDDTGNSLDRSVAFFCGQHHGENCGPLFYALAKKGYHDHLLQLA